MAMPITAVSTTRLDSTPYGTRRRPEYQVSSFKRLLGPAGPLKACSWRSSSSSWVGGAATVLGKLMTTILLYHTHKQACLVLSVCLSVLWGPGNQGTDRQSDNQAYLPTKTPSLGRGTSYSTSYVCYRYLRLGQPVFVLCKMSDWLSEICSLLVELSRIKSSVLYCVGYSFESIDLDEMQTNKQTDKSKKNIGYRYRRTGGGWELGKGSIFYLLSLLHSWLIFSCMFAVSTAG